MFFPDRFICFVNILWSSRRYIIGEVETSWVNYTFLDDNGITFSYPSIWTVINDTNKDNDIIATLMPPSNLDLFAEKMIFGRERLQPKMSPHDYSNNAIKVLSMTMDNFQLLDSDSLVVSGPNGKEYGLPTKQIKE